MKTYGRKPSRRPACRRLTDAAAGKRSISADGIFGSDAFNIEDSKTGLHGETAQ